MSLAPDHGFFVGYLTKTPPAVRRTAIAAASLLVVAFALAGLLLGRDGDNMAAGASFSQSEIRVSGVIRARPYPLLVVPPDAAFPQGRTLMLSDDGKRAPDGLEDGKAVTLTGYVLRRGTIGMLVLGELPAGGPPASASASASAPVPQGRWRVSGEICDGKCALGSMHPGTGLAHKACANLCISGALAPVLAMRAPVLGFSFLLLADKDGGPMPPEFRDLTALPVELEGEIEQINDLLILRADWTKAKAL